MTKAGLGMKKIVFSKLEGILKEKHEMRTIQAICIFVKGSLVFVFILSCSQHRLRSRCELNRDRIVTPISKPEEMLG